MFEFSYFFIGISMVNMNSLSIFSVWIVYIFSGTNVLFTIKTSSGFCMHNVNMYLCVLC